MREYASILPGFWTGETGGKLRGKPDAQVLALYLMSTHHANMIGVYYCDTGYMKLDTGLPEDRVEAAIDVLEKLGFCVFDRESSMVFVVQMAKYQVGDELQPGDKRLIGIRKAYRAIRPPRMQSLFYDTYAEAYGLEQIAQKPKAPIAPPQEDDPPPQDAGQTNPEEPMTADEVIFHVGVPMLVSAQIPERQARSFLGGLRKGGGEAALVRAIQQCAKERPVQPLEWLAKAVPMKRGAGKQSFNKTDYGKGVSDDGSLE